MTHFYLTRPREKFTVLSTSLFYPSNLHSLQEIRAALILREPKGNVINANFNEALRFSRQHLREKSLASRHCKKKKCQERET